MRGRNFETLTSRISGTVRPGKVKLGIRVVLDDPYVASSLRVRGTSGFSPLPEWHFGSKFADVLTTKMSRSIFQIFSKFVPKLEISGFESGSLSNFSRIGARGGAQL